MHEDKFKGFIRYGNLNTILKTIEGSSSTPWSDNVEYDHKTNSVSLWSKGYQMKTTMDLAALSNFFTAKRAPTQGQRITLGMKECYALYRIDYPNSALYTTKNPDGSRYDHNFNEFMELIEIKSSSINKRWNAKYECPSRRLHAFTDNTLLNLKYKEEWSREDGKIYNVQSIEESNIRDDQATKNEHKFVENLLTALQERKSDKINKIWFYPKIMNENCSPYIVMENEANIYIYQVNYEAHTFDPPLRFEKVFDSPYYEESRSRKSIRQFYIYEEALKKQDAEKKTLIVVQDSNISQNDVKTLKKKYYLVRKAKDIYIWNALGTHCLKNASNNKKEPSVYNVQSIEESNIRDDQVTKNERKFVENLLTALQERKSDKINKIWFYPKIMNENCSPYIVMENEANIYIYQVNYEAHTFDTYQRFAKGFDSAYIQKDINTKYYIGKKIRRFFKCDKAFMNQYVTGTNFIVVQKSNIPQNDVKTLEKKFGLVIQAEDIYIWNALCTHCLKDVSNNSNVNYIMPVTRVSMSKY